MEDGIEGVKNLIIAMSEKAGMKWLFDTHTAKAAEKAEWLLERLPEADRAIVMLSVWLHDIYYLIDMSKEEAHAALGAVEAARILRERGFSEGVVVGVAMPFARIRARKRTSSPRRWKRRSSRRPTA